VTIDASSLYGTLNMLLLQVLEHEELHGLEIQRRIEQLTRASLHIEEGALYPALRRLEKDGLVSSGWGVSDKRRRARFYRMTAKGKRRLARERANWLEYVRAVGSVLRLDAEKLP
jgi:PadR family transcriptional regulator PadR